MYNAERLKVFRSKAKLTQKQAGLLIGTTEAGWQQYEHGRRQPGAELICKICKALKCSPNELLGMDDQGNDID